MEFDSIKENTKKRRISWVSYTLCAILILLFVPVMRILFYERSKDWIRMIHPYKTPWLTGVMQAYSEFGDGELYTYICAFIMGLGYQKDYMYLMICYILNFHWSNLLKSALHHSRPQFDDPSLGEINSGICAGEFGNPSGHALLTAQFLINLNLLYRERLSEKLPKKELIYLIDGFIWFQILAVCLCRLYLGRHSVDQIILGLALGTLTAYFLHNEIRPVIYETLDRPKWVHFKVAVIVASILTI